MNKLFESWRGYLNEATPFGGDRPGIAGTMRNNPNAITNIYDSDEDTTEGEDLERSVKAVMHRNGQVLLLKNEKGWDLPGGHMKRIETIDSSLHREIFEETGLNIIEPKVLNYKHGNKVFFQGAFGAGEPFVSGEHKKYGFFNIDQIEELHSKGLLADEYKLAIDEALAEPTINENKKIKISIYSKKS